MARIASFGDISIDLMMEVDRYPMPGEETFAPHALTGLGGSAVTTAANLARLGFEVGVLGQVGDDQFGEAARQSLIAVGVDTSFVRVADGGPTGMNVVIVDPDGERSMIGVGGVNRSYPGTAGWERGCGWLHMSAYALLEGTQRESALAALDLARSSGIPISVDVPSGVAQTLGSQLPASLRDAAIVSIGRASIAHLAPEGDPIPALLDVGIGTLAVTDGERPFEVHRRRRWVRLTPPRVEVVDTTGAGDSFMAGLIAAELWGLAPGPMAALAAIMGAAATRREGAGNRPDVSLDLKPYLEVAAWTDIDPSWLTPLTPRL